MTIGPAAGRDQSPMWHVINICIFIILPHIIYRKYVQFSVWVLCSIVYSLWAPESMTGQADQVNWMHHKLQYLCEFLWWHLNASCSLFIVISIAFLYIFSTYMADLWRIYKGNKYHDNTIKTYAIKRLWDGGLAP